MSQVKHTDVFVVGAGPVGLMCAWLGKKYGLDVVIADKSAGPLEVGRADALNARTLQLMSLAGLFDTYLGVRGLPAVLDRIRRNASRSRRRV